MSSPGESLGALATLVGGRVLGDPALRVVDVSHDSRASGAGCLFVAIRGLSQDGHRFISDAVAQGAAAVCADHPVEAGVPVLVVADTRAVLGPLAAAVHGDPSTRLDLVGVTGTNGKTSVTYAVEAIASAAGRTPGVIGTIQTRVGGSPIPTLRTTPEASDLQRLLRRMLERGADLVAAEVSSHALELGRVDGAHFAVAAFTNLSQDHLDFHGDIESYYLAKRRLFDAQRSRRAVVFVDDPWGRRLAGEISLPLTTVSLSGEGDLNASIVESGIGGSVVWVGFPDGSEAILRLPLPGRFSVANALVAAACSLAVGIGPEQVVAGLEASPPVPGRFELVSGEDPVRVIVDYAHTPAGIAGAIESARLLTSGRVLVVMGAGGDRDRAKRPLMGAAAGDADLVVVTSDNPRSEDPEAIIDAVLGGVPGGTEVRRISERREAIASTLAEAEPGDMVLVLGKGHERGQEIGGKVIPFDDRAVVRSELARLRGSTA